MSITGELTHPDATVALGAALGRVLQAGDLVVLSGELGAGKTVLVTGVAAGLGVSGRVSSPTFVLARTHPAGLRGVPLVHVDAYRLGGDLAQLDDLDLDTELASAAVVVEWGVGLAEMLSGDYLLVALERREGDARGVHLTAYGSWRQRPLGDLAELVAR